MVTDETADDDDSGAGYQYVIRPGFNFRNT